MNKKHFYIAFTCCVLIVIVFSCKTMIEPDIWWQITTGEWILQHHQVPKTDVLSYTYAGEPWVNIKWMSEVAMYLIAHYSSAEIIYFVLGLCFIPILFFSYRIYIFLSSDAEKKFSFTFIFALLLFIVAISHRINGRPEVFSYLFASLYLLIFSISSRNKFYLLSLVPLQVAWCNIHEAYGVGIVMVLIFAVSELITAEHSKKIYPLLVAALCLAGLVLNPIGVKIYAYTINIFTQLDKNKFTSELLDFTASDYWDIFSILNVLCFLVSSYSIFKLCQEKKWSIKSIHQKIPLYYLAIFFAFFYLSLKSNRNIPFFQIVALPIYAGALSQLTATLLHSSKWLLYGAIIVLYLSIVTNTFYKTFDKHNEFGLGVSPVYNPIGTTQYLGLHQRNAKVFSDFLSSNYPLYHLRPQFKSYIDLRDLDVFPAKFFENCLYLYQDPNRLVSATQTLWQMADSIDQFDYVLLVNQPDFIPLHQELHRSGRFQPVYVDANSSLYQRKNGAMNAVNIDSFFHHYTFYKPSALGRIINHIFNPFFENIEDRNYDYEDLKSFYQNEYM